jgi:hypothetical protein
MPRFKSLPLTLRVLILVVALGIVLLIVAINLPGIATATFERFSGFLGGGPQQVGTQERTSSQADDYPSEIKDIQAKSEESFQDTDNRFARFDSLTSSDLEKMKTDYNDLGSYLDETDNLDPPEKYKDQHKLFRSAIADLYQAAGLAYSLASNPGSLTKSNLDEYHSYADSATSNLQQSDEILGQENLKGSSTTTIEGMTVAQLFDGNEKRYINVHAKAKEGEAHPLGIACADLTPATGSDANQEKSREVELTPSRDSGVSGTATFQDTGSGVEVDLNIEGAPEGGVEHLAHIHSGATCQDDRNDQGGPVEFPLYPVKVRDGG